MPERFGEQVARRLTELVFPHAVVHPGRHVWKPCGIADISEAKVGETLTFPSEPDRETLTNWWLVVRPRGGRTPPGEMRDILLASSENGWTNQAQLT